MNITRLELLTVDLQAQKAFYLNVLELPVKISEAGLEVKAGNTDILFTQADLISRAPIISGRLDYRLRFYRARI